MQFTERPEWGAWVTPKLLRQRPVYRWYVYPHSYDKELVITLLNELKVQRDECVWDPFVGAGTTLLACREYGCSAVGTDLLPLSVLVTRAKIGKYDHQRLASELEKFSFKLPAGIIDRFAPIPVVKKSLNAERRRQVSYLLNQIDSLPASSGLFFRLALLRCLDDFGLAVKSGGWLRIDPERNVNGNSLKTLFCNYTRLMLEDVGLHAERQIHDSVLKVKLADARTARTGQLMSACITSPPYLNRHDYTRVFAQELALIGVTSPAELISLRRRTLRSHVEARPLPHIQKGHLQLPPIIPTIVAEIESAGVNNPQVPKMVTGYFEDMLLVMQNIARNLRPKGVVALVVGNTRFSGIMIPVDEILVAMGPAAGLEPDQIIVTRHRGNSAQQMGIYGREPSRESVVILRKPSDG